TKNQCIVYSFEFEENGGQINTRLGSLPPDLSEKIDESAKAIKSIAGDHGRRAASSSSNSTQLVKKNKKRKLHHNGRRTDEKSGALDSAVTAPVPGALVPVLPVSTISTFTIDPDDQPSDSSDQQSCISITPNENSTKKNATTVSHDIDSLVQQSKVLRDKIIGLQEEFLYQLQKSI
ncbi:unnamed protein product, partial [Rotaria sp. Silwood2]